MRWGGDAAEFRMAIEGRHHDFLGLLSAQVVLRDLLVVLDPLGAGTGGFLAVDELGRRRDFAELLDLFGGEHVGDAGNHRAVLNSVEYMLNNIPPRPAGVNATFWPALGFTAAPGAPW
jgi:hypothetical protein